MVWAFSLHGRVKPLPKIVLFFQDDNFLKPLVFLLLKAPFQACASLFFLLEQRRQGKEGNLKTEEADKPDRFIFLLSALSSCVDAGAL